MKYFRMSYDEVLYKRSYLNLLLLNRAIPGIKPFDEKDEEGEDDDMIEVKIHANSFFESLM